MTGIELIAIERNRHQSMGYDDAHDDTYVDAELASAALAYLDLAIVQEHSPEAVPQVTTDDIMEMNWPWDAESWSPGSTSLRNLVKAGALIAAEIDRICRVDEAETRWEAKDGAGQVVAVVHPARCICEKCIIRREAAAAEAFTDPNPSDACAASAI